MTGKHARAGLGWCLGAAVVIASGCSKEGGDAPAAGKTSPGPATPAAASAPATTPAAGQGGPATAGASASAPSAAGEPSVNPLFTLPPSKGPAPYQFQQVTLLRSGPSGDLEMQLTGDGIYRIRDHGRGKSYSGDGKLAEPQIAEWAAAMKDWELLKDRYVPTPPPADADTVEIIYGGKKVVANPVDKDTPAAFTTAYKRLLDLDAQSRKEATAAEAAAPPPAAAPVDPAAAGKGTPPTASSPAEPAGQPHGVTPDAGPPATNPAK
jgi:hypothetical protein